MKNLKKMLGSLLLVLAGAGSLFAGGFQIYQAASSEAKALGAAVVARDDLISAAWYNPAAVMGYDKKQYSSGYSFAWIGQDYDPGNGQQTITKKDKMHIIPNTHYIHPINEKYTFVFSNYTPYGLGMQWNDDDIRRLASTGLYNDTLLPNGTMLVKGLPTQVDLQIPYVNFALTTAASRKFSVSGGLSVMKGNMKLRILSRINNPATNAALAESVMKYQADGWGFGFVLAGHYKMNPEWNLGFRYLSTADVEMKGTVEDHLDPTVGNARMKGTLNLPANFTLGFANSSIDNWILSGDILWTGWSRFDRLIIEPRDAGMTKGGINVNKDWSDTLAYRFGAEYQYSDLWVWRWGYVYDNSPVSDVTRSLDLPGADGHIVSFGCTRRFSVWDVDFGYSYMILKTSTPGTESMNGVGEFKDGYNHFVSLNFSRSY
ncbi:MAG: outer membrane protein transport protein [Candidatus Riflebacteria bacterium]